MKDSEKVTWDQGRCPSPAQARSSASQKLMVWLMFLVSLTYMAYTLNLVSTSTSSSTCNHAPFIINHLSSTTSFPSSNGTKWPEAEYSSSSHNSRTGKGKRGQKTELRHLVFGIAASSKLWEHRKNYIKIWYKKEKMRGVVWLDDRVKTKPSEGLPPTKVSTDTSNFVYTNKLGHRSAIRISRIVTETLRMGHKDVRWFVMGDDDTVFVTDNLLRILNKYDHNYMYYIGSLSESHLQNIFFSYGMAYGGGGFAISYPLAKALSKMQDRCIQRYPALYGSDDRMQACMAELGVPLTKEIGFHQYDVYGNLFGLLAAHPVTPLVSLHHLDVVEPIFPNATRVEAIKRLTIPMKLDSASLIQQSICHDRNRRWTISVSWGFSVQIFRGIFTQREMEMPSRTFLNWYRRADYTAYAFNTRPFSRNPCQKPFVFYFSKAKLNSTLQQTVTEYERDPIPPPECRWNMADPSALDKIEVHKKKDPHLWDRAPRRNCCRVMKSNKTGSLKVEVAVCRDGEFSEPA